MKTIAKILMMVVVVSITGCQKKPIASFTLSSDTVFIGDDITCTNTSIDGDHYQWISDNGIDKTKDCFLWTTRTGEKDVTLQVFSKNGKKMSECKHTYTVIDHYNMAFFANYKGSASNYIFKNPTSIILNGFDEIIVDGGFGTTLSFNINSQTGGPLMPKTYAQGSKIYNFKTGSITKNGNFLTISMIMDYTDNLQPSQNVTNYSVNDVIEKL